MATFRVVRTCFLQQACEYSVLHYAQQRALQSADLAVYASHVVCGPTHHTQTLVEVRASLYQNLCHEAVRA